MKVWNGSNLAKCIKSLKKISISFESVIPFSGVICMDIKKDIQTDLGALIVTVLYNGISIHISEKLEAI